MAVHRRPSEAQGVAVDFQKVPELQQFVIPNVRPTGRELGRGSYGAVEEVEIPGATCAAKTIHETLLRFGSEDEVRNITEKFVRECCLMSSLRHPHVVQFLGVCFLPASRLPALVMEKLLVSLHELLETNPNIPLATKRSVLHDVARGLLYIHSRNPPIIHRDLTAKNVLMNSAMVAKLADLGVARIVESHPGQMAAQLTQAPGTAVYMPPEALEPEGTYDTKLDIFSFGNVALFSLTQSFPARLKFPTYTDPTTRRRIARSEVERRSDYIQQMHEALGQQHVLVRIVEQCLQDLPEDRPSIEGVVQRLEEASTQIHSQYGEMTKLELEQEIQSLQGRLENADLQQRLQLTPQPSLTGASDVASNEKQWDPMQPKELNLKWRRGHDTNLRLGSTVQMAVLDGTVYMETEGWNNSGVVVYDSQEERWSVLCDRGEDIRECAMVLQDDQLVLAGGFRNPHWVCNAQNMVAVWDVSSKSWQYPYPPMPTPRYSALAISCQHYMIIVGGFTYSQSGECAAAVVEVLDTSRSQWYIAESLPEPCRLKQCVVIGDTLYLLGSHCSLGRDDQLIFECSVSTLISLATSESTATLPTWKTLPDTQLNFCSLLTYKDSLLAVGGLKSQKISGIYIYKSDTSEWSKIGDLPTALHNPICILLPSNDLYVLSNNTVYIGTSDSL